MNKNSKANRATAHKNKRKVDSMTFDIPSTQTGTRRQVIVTHNVKKEKNQESKGKVAHNKNCGIPLIDQKKFWEGDRSILLGKRPIERVETGKEDSV